MNEKEKTRIFADAMQDVSSVESATRVQAETKTRNFYLYQGTTRNNAMMKRLR